MNGTQQPSDAFKSVEENPENQDPTPNVDEGGEPLPRHNGKSQTTTGGASVSELTANL